MKYAFLVIVFLVLLFSVNVFATDFTQEQIDSIGDSNSSINIFSLTNYSLNNFISNARNYVFIFNTKTLIKVGNVYRDVNRKFVVQIPRSDFVNCGYSEAECNRNILYKIRVGAKKEQVKNINSILKFKRSKVKATPNIGAIVSGLSDMNVGGIN